LGLGQRIVGPGEPGRGCPLIQRPGWPARQKLGRPHLRLFLFCSGVHSPVHRRGCIAVICRPAIMRPRLAPSSRSSPFGCCATLTTLAVVAPLSRRLRGNAKPMSHQGDGPAEQGSRRPQQIRLSTPVAPPWRDRLNEPPVQHLAAFPSNP
jgi:hypothetical protein